MLEITPVDRRLTALLERWPPTRIVWALLTIHVLIWWLLPALLQHNLPLDVIEQLAWGREWQMDYYKHPPLPAWILEAIAIVSGRGPPALYLAGPLASAASLFAVWRLGCVMIGERRAMLAVLAQTGVVYFTIFMPEFNHYVILLPLWVQIDGSEHAWFEDRGACAVHAAGVCRRRDKPIDGAAVRRLGIGIRLFPRDARLSGDTRQAGRVLQRQA